MAATDSPNPEVLNAAHPLTDEEVEQRTRDGLTNESTSKESRSVASILRGNIFTRFNAIISAMLVVIFVFGEPADAMFGLVMVFNALIGIIQELRAKRTLDRLTVLITPKATVTRARGPVEISADDVVLDDLLKLGRGEQVPVDALVYESDGLEVSEALLTGEAEPIDKHTGDSVFSGSFVVAGTGTCLVTAVGDDAYANRLAAEAKKFTLARSDLTDAINQILRIVTWLLLPTSALLLWSQIQSGHTLADAAVSTVAGVVAMVPQGLVLLVSMAFAVAVIRLGQRNVLVQELPAVETLARVDLLCVDKTGTLTDGTISFENAKTLDDSMPPAEATLARIAAADPDPNPTMAAIAAGLPTEPSPKVDARMAFSSERKVSAVAFSDGTAWLMGAPEIVLAGVDSPSATKDADRLAAQGRRAVVVAQVPHDSVVDGSLAGARPAYLLEFAEQLRPDAPDTVDYFTDQNVDLKVISGDSPVTVAAVANAARVPNTSSVDARDMPGDATEFLSVADATGVFGRVTPERKRELVNGFQGEGHVVAMTGDGVNDVLALKDADLGIAMGAGSGATRAVSQLVLLDNAFSALPHVVAEGRRVVANMERVSSLFLTKTVYATLLAVLIGFIGLTFPFLPRHLTLIGSLTIGIPAFLLSFEPQERPIREGFLPRVLAFAIPAGLVTGVATFTLYGVSRIDALDLSLDQSRTAATTMMVVVGLVVLYELIEPIELHHALMIGALFAMYVFVLAVPVLRDTFMLLVPQWQAWVVIAVMSLVAGLILKLLTTWSRRWISRKYGIEGF
ncbi:MAG: HAD-IC family P-type ATPase [Acidimicrobiia bacterium]